MELYEFIIPQWALCAIVNGDFTGLTDEEEEKVTEFMNKYGGRINVKHEEPYFSHRNDLDGYLGADVYDCELWR